MPLKYFLLILPPKNCNILQNTPGKKHALLLPTSAEETTVSSAKKYHAECVNIYAGGILEETGTSYAILPESIQAVVPV